MQLFNRKQKQKRGASGIGLWLPPDGDSSTGIQCPGYTRLDKCPEVMTACRRIAEIIGSLTIHLMENTDSGDKRIINELSRKLDIDPTPYMTRKTWMESVVMNLLLYGNGNSVVRVHTAGGFLNELEPIEANRVTFDDRTKGVYIDGKPYTQDEVLHFVLNPDPHHLWRGQGLRASLKPLADALKQADATKLAFLSSKFQPSLIVKVDALTEEFASPEGRQRLLDSYVKSGSVGEPWIIPAEQFSVEQVSPLSLSDLALSDTVEADKRTLAAVLGVPAFLLGVGDYNKEAWNAFVNNTVKPIVIGIQQELTRKLILSPKWYLKFNILSLLDWDIQTIADVFGGLSDRGFVTGNEVRDRMGMSPKDGLDDLRVLENYIPYDLSGAQKKLVQGGETDGTA